LKVIKAIIIIMKTELQTVSNFVLHPRSYAN